MDLPAELVDVAQVVERAGGEEVVGRVVAAFAAWDDVVDLDGAAAAAGEAAAWRRTFVMMSADMREDQRSARRWRQQQLQTETVYRMN